jgi:hypothetical protein
VVKLSWQMTVLYGIAMLIMGAIIIIGFYNDQAAELSKYALGLIAALLGYGGGKLQTVWEIRKVNNGGSNDGSTQPVERDGRAEDDTEG